MECIAKYFESSNMVAAPLILGGDLKISDQNNWGGDLSNKLNLEGELNLREDLKI